METERAEDSHTASQHSRLREVSLQQKRIGSQSERRVTSDCTCHNGCLYLTGSDLGLRTLQEGIRDLELFRGVAPASPCPGGVMVRQGRRSLAVA